MDAWGDDLLLHLVRYFEAQPAPDDDDFGMYEWMSGVLRECKFQRVSKPCYQGDDEYGNPVFDGFDYTLTLFVPVHNVRKADQDFFRGEVKTALTHLLDEDKPWITVRVKALTEADPQNLGLNNCSFKQERTILHDGLRFRSRGEIAIYDELKQRNVLFFPNAAAVFGTSGGDYGEKVEKKEPDFLVCFKGKWGILEVNGDDFHSGVVSTAKDHERARRFNRYGLFFVQAYDCGKCKSDPLGVVDEFLQLLANHK